MKWISAYKYWPAMDSRNMIVDGEVYLYLKPKYTMPDHSEPIMVCVAFYCLVKDSQPWTGTYNNQFSLDGALIYEFKSYCCNGEGDKEEHDKYLRDIGCYPSNIMKFLDKKDFTAPWDSIKRWAYLKDKKHE